MTIKTTIEVSRSIAVARIAHIHNLALLRRYHAISSATSEHTAVQQWVDNYPHRHMNSDTLSTYTNSMLGDLLDEEFFRWSKFENYIVVDEE